MQILHHDAVSEKKKNSACLYFHKTSVALSNMLDKFAQKCPKTPVFINLVCQKLLFLRRKQVSMVSSPNFI